jgi:hypothetical protein
MWRPEDQPPGGYRRTSARIRDARDDQAMLALVLGFCCELGAPVERSSLAWAIRLRRHSTKSSQNTKPWKAGKAGKRNHPRAVEYETPTSTANSLAFSAWFSFPERRPASRCEVVCLLASMGGLRFGLTRTYALALMTIRRMFLLQMQSHLVPKIEHAFFPGGSLVLRSKAILLGHAQSNLRLLLHCPLQRA